MNLYLEIVGHVPLLGGDNLIDPHGSFCFRVNPEEWVMPVIGEFNLN